MVEDAVLLNENEVLSFRLGAEEYGISILKVQEIRGYEAVTKLANAPDYLKGVINLRGIIVPIIDLRVKFNIGQPMYDELTVVIILNIGHHVIGAVVDGVSEVVNLSPDQIKPAPEMNSVIDTAYLRGIGAIEDRMLILLDIDQLMASDDMGLIKKLAA